MKAGRPVYTKALPTLADGLAVPEVSSSIECLECFQDVSDPVCEDMVNYFLSSLSQVGINAFACAQPCVDRMVVVSEKDIALAILRLVEIEKSVVEGAGATALAACLSGKLDHLQGKK